MDLLARLVAPAQDLLDRVDRALLAGGAPGDHPIWPLLRRVGALPGELVAELSVATPDALRVAGDPLRGTARSYVDGPDLVPGTAGWRGAAAEQFGAQWQALAGHLAGGSESMAGRLADTASYLDGVTGWLAATRDAVALAVAESLGSAEAVTLRALPDGALDGSVAGLTRDWAPEGGRNRAIRAAATIGAHVLLAAAGALDEGEALRSRWAGRLDELPYRAATGPGPAPAQHLALPG